MRVYLSTAEAELLLELPIPRAVRLKLAAKLKPADPIPGQQSIYDVLTEEDHGDTAVEPEASAT